MTPDPIYVGLKFLDIVVMIGSFVLLAYVAVLLIRMAGR